MKPFLLILIIASAISLAACTTPSAVMRSWVGNDESELLASWGAPDSMMVLDDGRKIYTWIRIWSDNSGVHQGRQTFTIDPDGKVSNYSYENMPPILMKW